MSDGTEFISQVNITPNSALARQDKSNQNATPNASSREVPVKRLSDEKVSMDDMALQALGNVKLSITIDETDDLPIIKIFDSETGKELLQVPAEHSLNISRSIKAAVGAIFDKSA